MQLSNTLTTASYRSLLPEEVEQLRRQGCWAQSWEQVLVHPQFRPDRVWRVRFLGPNHLGVFRHQVLLPGGVEHPSGVYDATLCHTAVGEDALVRGVRRHLAQVDIHPKAVVEDVELLASTGNSGFGNGVRCQVLVEDGQRALPLFDRMSAHVAWLLLFWAWGTPAWDQWLEAIEQYAQHQRGDRSQVGPGAQVCGCGTLINLRVGPHAQLLGVARATNGTVHGHPDAPGFLGHGVVADQFILGCGARVDSQAVLECSYVGQGAVVHRGFSAIHSLVFANADLAHGEATSALVGPFTTSHHRSSLLIAGAFLFFNAGSATNESNHWYKLGPCHHGQLGRGTKTASDCYMRWPCRIGEFTIVAGRHYGPLDTTAFPFSYLLGQQGQSVLLPGANVARVGPWRDWRKWPRRDRRTGTDRLEWLHLDLFSPATVGKCEQALDLLTQLQRQTSPPEEPIPFHGTIIPRQRLGKAVAAYRLAMELFLGQQVLERLRNLWASDNKLSAQEAQELWRRFIAHHPTGQGPWVDLGGMFIPAEELERLLGWFESGASLERWAQLETHLAQLHQHYEELCWNWAVGLWSRWARKPAENLGWSDVKRVLEVYLQALEQYRGMVLQDAQGELEAIGWGKWPSQDHRSNPLKHPTLEQFLHFISSQRQMARELLEQIAGLI